MHFSFPISLAHSHSKEHCYSFPCFGPQHWKPQLFCSPGPLPNLNIGTSTMQGAHLSRISWDPRNRTGKRRAEFGNLRICLNDRFSFMLYANYSHAVCITFKREPSHGMIATYMQYIITTVLTIIKYSVCRSLPVVYNKREIYVKHIPHQFHHAPKNISIISENLPTHRISDKNLLPLKENG